MRQFEISKRRGRRTYLQLEKDGSSHAEVCQAERQKDGTWEVTSIRVPIEPLREAVAKVTIRHEMQT